jgi:hypothetical protein
MSDILIEIAKIGFKSPFREADPAPKTAHILTFLASKAWNREVYAGQGHASFEAPDRIVEVMVKDLSAARADLERELISTDWETLIEMMQIYKRKHFPDDTRQILLCGYTPRGTVRVEWQ